MSNNSILVRPTHLRQSAVDMYQSAKVIQSCVEEMDQRINELDSARFEGISAGIFRFRYKKMRRRFFEFKPLVDSFARQLEAAADRFEKADRSLEGAGGGNAGGGEAPATAGGGQTPTIGGGGTAPSEASPPSTSDGSSPASSELNRHELKSVDPKDYSSCAIYAQKRRPDLGTTGGGVGKYPENGAANYISKFKDTAFQVNGGTGDLSSSIAPGYAVVWEPGVRGANSTYGHVAIVEEVGPDYVVVSHSGWSEGTSTKIPLSKLQDLWLIP